MSTPKTCSCSGNNSLRMAIGAVRCTNCGGQLNTLQIQHRLISRLEEIEEEQSRQIEALQVLGADRCDKCGTWSKDTWSCRDRCWCYRCLEFNQDGPIMEDDDEDLAKELARSLVAFLSSRGKPVKFNGILLETYKATIANR